jgi:hypothetical protein
VADPLSVTGTFKSPEANAAYVYDSDQRDAAAAKGGGRDFRASGSDMPPRETEGWRRGDWVSERTPSSGDNPSQYQCTWGGAVCDTAHANTTAFAAGAWCYTGGNVYAAATGGTTGTGTAPSGTSTGQTDGTVEWDYVDTRAVFDARSDSRLPVHTAANIADASAAVNTGYRPQGWQVFDSTNGRVMVSNGSSTTSDWKVSDGSATVTPT